MCYYCDGFERCLAYGLILCPNYDDICVIQKIKVGVGKFPVAYIKLGEGGFGENVVSVHLLWTMFPFLQVELSWGWSGECWVPGMCLDVDHQAGLPIGMYGVHHPPLLPVCSCDAYTRTLRLGSYWLTDRPGELEASTGSLHITNESGV